MRTLLLIFSLLLISIVTRAQSEKVPSYWKIQGTWRIKDGNNSLGLLIFRKNNSILIDYTYKDSSSYIYGFPYSYYGFLKSSKSDYPKNISELDSAGNVILFYDDLGKSYDTSGHLFLHTRSCWVTYNENLDPDHEPVVLSFYYKSTPDVYVRAKSIPDSVLLSIKRNSKSWQKYIGFLGITEKKVKTTRAIIYSNPKIPTKMYLVVGDDVVVAEQKGEWTRIRYYGTRLIEGWIRTSDIEK
jgi:hypothetical protein